MYCDALIFLTGGGVCVTTLVLGAVSLVSPGVILSRRPFLRDILFYTVSSVALMLIVFDGEIHLFESVCFVGIYLLYVYSNAHQILILSLGIL